jgi:hypothetical protein
MSLALRIRFNGAGAIGHAPEAACRVCRYSVILEGNKMKVIAPLVAICWLSQAAFAAGPECKSLSAPGERLACYDKAAAAEKAVERPVASKTPKPDQPRYVDTIGEEDARMNARLKNICRGC